MLLDLKKAGKISDSTYKMLYSSDGLCPRFYGLPKIHNLSLTEYIDKATILCDQCEYPPEARDRLPRDAIVIGLRSKEAYYKCIEKGSELTLGEALEIAQNQDATAHQVGYIRPEFKGEPLQMEVHKLQENSQSRASRNREQPQRPASNDQKQEGNLFLLWSETVTSQK